MSNFEKMKFEHGRVSYPSFEKAYSLINTDNIPFSSVLVGVTRPSSDYFVHRNSKTTINVFEYVVSGEGEILIDGVWRTARAGSFYILAQGEEHYYKSSKKDPWEKIWVNYKAEYMPSFLKAYGVRSGIFHSQGVKELIEEITSIIKSHGNGVESVFGIADRINEIVKIAAKELSVDTGGKYGMKRLIESYVHKKLDLDEVASELNMSKSNVIRVFKKEYGTTPYEYILNLKMETAKTLLRYTGLPMWKISEKLCISDEHYFSSMFLKRVGMRPGEYRRKHRQ